MGTLHLPHKETVLYARKVRYALYFLLLIFGFCMDNDASKNTCLFEAQEEGPLVCWQAMPQ